MAAVTAAVAGVAVSAYSAKKASDNAKAQNKIAREGIEAADPYKQYRAGAAERLDKLMSDPSSIEDTATYKARMVAAERQMAAQGYSGSGNAILEAADAGGAAYQQEFANLSMLSGAGQAPGGGYAQAQQTMAEGNAQKLSAYAGVGNNLTNLISQFNKPATAAPVRPAGG